MNILSFTYFDWGHDTSAAIVCDGVLVAAAEEERFSRQKHDSGFPFQAIDFCLRRAGIGMAQVDVIAFPQKPFLIGSDSELPEMELALLQRWKAEGKIRYRRVLLKRLFDAYVRLGLPSFNWRMDPTVAKGFAALRERYAEIPPIRYYDHHLAHAAAAYFTSGYDRATVVTMDGNGGSYATVTWTAQGFRISRLGSEPRGNSIGFFYYDCSGYLGLGEYGEGKTMGLAPYGNKEVYAGQVSSLLDLKDSSWYRYRRRLGQEVLGFPQRHNESIVEPPYPDFAAACQDAVERGVARVVRSAIHDAKSRNLCLGGGVMLNCSSNGALLASGVADSIWVFPAAGDAGLSVGAALLCAADAGELDRVRLDHAYWGPDFSPAEYEAALQCEPRIVYRLANNLAAEVAGSLAAGEVVGWFQGRMEFGPRALGNRSILADPRMDEMRHRVNRLKGREAWRPLAPVVLAESTSEFFTVAAPSPFMLFATQVRSPQRSLIPAVVHVDGSARPQTVTRDQNPALYDLISAWGRKTGVPVLLNTSFNAAAEPIVCTPKDAIKMFLATKLDLLVLGDYVIKKRHTHV